MIASTVSPQQAVTTIAPSSSFRRDRQSRSFPVPGKDDDVSRAKPPGRTRERLPSAIRKPLDQCQGEFDVGSAGFASRAVTTKLRGKDLGVVEHHHIAGPQKRG